MMPPGHIIDEDMVSSNDGTGAAPLSDSHNVSHWVEGADGITNSHATKATFSSEKASIREVTGNGSTGGAPPRAPLQNGLPHPHGPSPVLHNVSFEDEVRTEFETINRKLDGMILQQRYAKQVTHGHPHRGASNGAIFHDRSKPLQPLVDGELGLATASSMASFQPPLAEMLSRVPKHGEIEALRIAAAMHHHGHHSHHNHPSTLSTVHQNNSSLSFAEDKDARPSEERRVEDRRASDSSRNASKDLSPLPAHHNTSSVSTGNHHNSVTSSQYRGGSAASTRMDLQPLQHRESFPSAYGEAKSNPAHSRRNSILSEATRVLRQKEVEQLQLLENHQRHGVLRCLDDVWNFLEYPESSTGAHIFARITPFYIVLTVAVTLVQSIDEKEVPLSGVTAAIIETSIDLLYFLEFIVRLLACPNKRVFFRSLFNFVDFFAVLPLIPRIYVGFIIPRGKMDDPPHFILLGVVPIIRLLKTLRRFEKLQLLFDAFAVALEALPVLLFTLLTIALTFSVLVYLAEPREVIPHLPYSLWFTLVTMTTVGYGDTVPSTTAGCVVTSCLIICTMLYLAVPLGIIGSAFDQTWNDRDRILLMQRTRERLNQWGYTARDIPVLFKLADSDDDGELHFHDFENLLTRMQIGLSSDRILALFQNFDRDGSGAVDSKEFVKTLFPYSYHEIFEDDLVYESS
mmetsp:Transcript_7906/g.17579  ORF Transcript_7906/g.17579 Transcript_7906/m.17579 type:complete len:685 (+) Transcript_7906:99-2153(+)